MDWKTIPDFPKYQANSLGEVRNIRTGWVLATTLTRGGYPIVSVYRTGRICEPRTVHRLVLETFVGPRPSGFECCHYDGDKTNNHLSNLRWDTKYNNSIDRRRHGTETKGKVSENDVREIRRLHASGASDSELATRYGIARSTVYCITHRETWRHVD